jgi:hypothetical protein
MQVFHKFATTAGCWWLTPIILAIQEAEIRKIGVWGQGKYFERPYLENTQYKKEVAECLKW